MKNYCFETTDIKFELVFDKFFEEDYKQNNPYNTSIYINVKSFDFSGKSDWIVDYGELQEFAYKLKKLYDELKGELQFVDKEYKSELKIKCEKLGHISFSGKLISSTFQKLEFQFTIDQTYIGNFVENLYNDLGKNFQERKKKKR